MRRTKQIRRNIKNCRVRFNPDTAFAAGALLGLFCIPLVAAPQREGAPPLTNLQVLPADMPRELVIARMQEFTQALGVQCTYCHSQAPPELVTPEEAAAAQGRGRGRGQGPPPIDFASDAKSQKQIARDMLRMVDDINARLSASLGKPSASLVRVQCVTCHRGVDNPRQLADMLWQTMVGKGDGAAVALYRELRQKYYGSQAYDFRESLLLSLAERSLAANKADDALAWLQLNLEFYPQSVESYLSLSQAHMRKGDWEATARDLSKVLTLDPSNGRAKRQIEALKQLNAAHR